MQPGSCLCTQRRLTGNGYVNTTQMGCVADDDDDDVDVDADDDVVCTTSRQLQRRLAGNGYAYNTDGKLAWMGAKLGHLSIIAPMVHVMLR